MKTEPTADQPDQSQQQPKPENTPATPAFTRFIERGIGAKKEKKPDSGAAGDAGAGDGGGDQPDKPQRPPKRTPVARPAPAAIDEERLGKSIADGLAPHLAAREEKAKAKDDENLTDADKRQIAVLLHMEQMEDFNGRYKGVSARYKTAMGEKAEYVAQWKKDHPGEDFDKDADEHQEFLDGIDDKIGYDPDDFDDARVDLKASQKVASTKKEIDERVSRIEKSEQVRARSAEINHAGAEASDMFWKEVVKDEAALAGIVDKDGKINGKAISDLRDSDEQTFNIVAGLADASKTYGSLIYTLDSGLVDYDKNNEQHQFVSNFAFDKEQQFLKAADEVRVDEEGREFATREEYLKMSAAQKAKHWHLTADDLRFMLTRHCAKLAKGDLEREEQKFRSRAKSRGLLKDDDAGAAGNRPQRNGQRPAATRLNDPANDDDDKPETPSTRTTPKTAVGNAALNDANKNPVDRFLGRYLK